jgi:hypothetical protein
VEITGMEKILAQKQLFCKSSRQQFLTLMKKDQSSTNE